MRKSIEILFLVNRPASNSQASTVTEYIDSFHKYSSYNIHELSMLHDFPSQLDLNRFDAIITHYSLSLGPLLHHYFGNELVKKIKIFKGLKVAILQDEYREIHTYWKNLRELDFDILFSCVPENEIQKVYPTEQLPKLRVVNILTGYVPEDLITFQTPPISERKIDVGYRSRKPPYWLGKLAYEKLYISEQFNKLAHKSGLFLDISTNESDRLYGKDWINFLTSCRTVIGTESGASIADFDGELERSVNNYVHLNPQASFDEIFELFLKPYEGSLKLNQISPRCFEAAALKTPMILFEGFYSGILQPNLHFIPLRKDFSNFEEVLLKLRNHEALQEIADRTYNEVALDPRWSYQKFIEKIDKIIAEEVENRPIIKAQEIYTEKQFNRAIILSLRFFIKRQSTLIMQRLILGSPRLRKMIFSIWDTLPYPVQKFIRPFARIMSK